MIINVLIAWFSCEGHKPHAEHIERRDRRTDCGCMTQNLVVPSRIVLTKEHCLLNDCILGIVTTETDDEWNARPSNRKATDQHRVRGVWHLMAQATHLRHFVRVAGVNHGARAHKQQAFEKRM